MSGFVRPTFLDNLAAYEEVSPAGQKRKGGGQSFRSGRYGQKQADPIGEGAREGPHRRVGAISGCLDGHCTVMCVKLYSSPTVRRGSATIGNDTISIRNVTLDALVDSGANAFVFRGTDVMLNRLVAVKVWPPRLDRPRVDRAKQALNEAKKLAATKSEYVVQVYHADRLSNGWVYVTMEFFDGDPIRKVRKSYDMGSSLDSSLAIRLMLWSCVARGLRDAESVDVYHGDLHGGNVLVKGFQAVIIDFGTSEFTGREFSLSRHAKMVHRFANWLLPELNTYLPSSDILDRVSPEYASRAVDLWVETAFRLRRLEKDLPQLTDEKIALQLSSMGRDCVNPWLDLSAPVATWLARRNVSLRNIERLLAVAGEENERLSLRLRKSASARPSAG